MVTKILMLHLYNTMKRETEALQPLNDEKILMFTCGPSVYQKPHIGNYRTFLYEDVLVRYLGYLGYDVIHAMAITDVEDKTIEEAQGQGVSIEDLTGYWIDCFFADAGLLRIKTPDHCPRSSTTVKEAVDIIKALTEKGFAYLHGGDVFYDPLKFRGFGRLFGLDMSRWPEKKRRFKLDTYPGMQWNRGDFIIWHGHDDPDEGGWGTEIGRGRPAWNVQDAAMIKKHLGMKIDIHCGGIDNLYRHHDYTIAIIEALTGEEFCRYWLHGEHLLVNGKKMSKRTGNVVYLDDLLNDGYSTEQVRFFLIYGNYRKKKNFTEKSLRASCEKLDELREAVGWLIKSEISGGISSERARELAGNLATSFEEHMNDDLDVKGAFDAVLEAVLELNVLNGSGMLGPEDRNRVLSELRRLDGVLQVIFNTE